MEVGPCKTHFRSEQGVLKSPGATGGNIAQHHQRLGNSPEHQADALAGCEQHREPGEVAERGLCVLATQGDLAVLACGDNDAEDERQGGHQDDPPGAVLGNILTQYADGSDELVAVNQSADNDDQRQADGDAADHVVVLDPTAKTGCTVLFRFRIDFTRFVFLFLYGFVDFFFLTHYFPFRKIPIFLKNP